MKRMGLLLLAGLACTPALAAGRLAEVTLVDRDTGRTLATHYHRGEYWVAGRPGAHYAIQIHNRTGARLLAVTSVDGVNIVTGETAAFDQRGYVFDPRAGYDIAGWRKSDSQIAAFTFTSIPKSYAARTGRPANVGVIGVALFRERPPPVAYSPTVAEAPTVVPLPAPPSTARAESQTANESSGIAADTTEKSVGREQRAQAPSLGTGHGRREHSQVHNVRFNRAHDKPDEIIRIRYDSHANLLAMGVIRATPPRQPQPFPDAPRLGYVPDP